MSWDEVVGQERVKKTLRAAIRKGRVAHAYLFHGPDGVGKDAMAIELARVLNCTTAQDEACGTCENCKRIRSLQHPDVMLVFALPPGKNEKAGDAPLTKLSKDDMDALHEQTKLKAANWYYDISVPRATTIKVNSIRELRRQASLTSFSAGRKVIIIFEAADMNDEAANALLKTLEEPMPDTVLILTTSRRDALLRTILSRCQQIRFDRVGEEDIRSYIHKHHGVEIQQAELISRLAHGSIGRALGLINTDVRQQRERAVAFLRKIASYAIVELSQFIDQLSREYDRSGLQRILVLMEFWLRDAFVISEGSDSIINLDMEESIRKFAAHYVALPYDEVQKLIERSVSLLDRNAYIPLVLYTLSIHLHRHLMAAQQPRTQESIQ